MFKDFKIFCGILLICTSCSYGLKVNPYKYGQVKFYNNVNDDAPISFSFYVNDEFFKEYDVKKMDKNYPFVSENEIKLLRVLLAQEGRCIDAETKKQMFRINSKQEKIYDITFQHLIEQNYNAKPVAPKMYFGEC